jgi:hypothetical protein
VLATAGEVIEQLFEAFISWHTCTLPVLLHRSVVGNRRYGSGTTESACSRHVRYSPNSVSEADMARCRKVPEADVSNPSKSFCDYRLCE